MDTIVVTGGRRLSGTLCVQGAKNAALPILAACLLSGKESVLKNCPRISDVGYAVEILKELGADIKAEGNVLTVNTAQVDGFIIPEHLMQKMRSSVMFLGAILARCKEARISYPGGCEIGARPVDMHLKALRELGVHIEESHGFINCKAEQIQGKKVHLDFPSVGATENVMLLASCTHGETVIHNAAREPEIVDLQNFINSMGGQITGAGSDEIHITGTEGLFHSTEYTVMSDRIAAATWLCAGTITGGDIVLQNAVPAHLEAVIAILREMGCRIITDADSIRLCGASRLRAVRKVRTQVYPGFPTDVQAPLTACFCVASGTSVIEETIFENRFRHMTDFVKMGANIDLETNCAVIRGVARLNGARVSAKELRGGAALVLAGLQAEGETVVDGVSYIDRGYESIENSLQALGADIKRCR